jgi:hypothetical protein
MTRRTLPAALGLAAVAVAVGLAQSPSALAASQSPHRAANAPGVEVCGTGNAVTRPASVILTCADDGEVATNLDWTRWSTTSAAATGLVAWRSPHTAGWESAEAQITLTAPVAEGSRGTLFTKLVLHVTGATPHGFMRDLTFDETPVPAVVARASADTRASSAATRTVRPAAASGTLGYAQIEGYWIDAGGGSSTAQTAAAITGAESSFEPGSIQQGTDYCGSGSDVTGWGLWQITCGNAVPAYGADFQLLDPWNNAEAAVSLYDSDAAAGANGFDRWSTYTSGAYESYVQNTAPDTDLTDPGEYTQVGSTPSGTPASPAADPGSTYGPALGGSSTGGQESNESTVVAPNGHMYKFARGTDGTLRMWSSDFTTGWVDQGADLGGDIVGSPAAVIAPNGHMYVFAEGTDHTLRMWSSDFTTGWIDNDAVVAGGAVAGSSPNAVIAPNGHMYVFAEGTDHTLRMWSSDFTTGWVDQGATVAGGAVAGSAPNAVIAPNGHMYVFAEGTDHTLRMWSSDFTTGWIDQGATVAGGAVDASAPDSVIAPNGHMYVFAEGTDHTLRMWSSDFTTGWVDQGVTVAGGAVAGSSPNAVIAPNGHMYVFAEGTDHTLRMWSSDFTTGWIDQGATVAGGAVDGGAPDSVIAPNGHMYVFAHGTDNTLRMWSSDFTTGWIDQGATIAGGPIDAS